jgi:phospholipase C
VAKPLPDFIEHIVVLMLENRSFDNVLGGLYPELTKRGMYRGLLGYETNPLDPAKPPLGSVTVFQGPAASSIWIMPYPDPGELYSDMVQQIFGSNSSVLPSGVLPPMSGFAWNYSGQPWSVSGPGWPSVPPVPRNIMQYYSGTTMPVTTYLAMQYAVCDGWFAAAPVQTLSNRVFTICGTPGIMPGSNPPLSRINNPDYTGPAEQGQLVTETTIFELLDNANPAGQAPPCGGGTPSTPLNWKIYYHDAPLSALCQYVWDRWCIFEDTGGNVFNVDDPVGSFAYDVAHNQLPAYSFIEPRYSDDNPISPGYVNSNHPGGAGIDTSNWNGDSLPPPINVMDGERLLCDVYSTLLANKALFAKTLLIVTYDEHGGLFDHVPPGPAESPFSTPVANFNYDRYGVRVPTIFINPSISPGTVYPGLRDPDAPLARRTFDHTSILKTVMEQFNVSPDALTKRVTDAPAIEGLFPHGQADYSRPPLTCPPPAPPSPKPARPKVMAPGLPQRSHTLAGALGILYEHIQKGKLGGGGR